MVNGVLLGILGRGWVSIPSKVFDVFLARGVILKKTERGTLLVKYRRKLHLVHSKEEPKRGRGEKGERGENDSRSITNDKGLNEISLGSPFFKFVCM